VAPEDTANPAPANAQPAVASPPALDERVAPRNAAPDERASRPTRVDRSDSAAWRPLVPPRTAPEPRERLVTVPPVPPAAFAAPRSARDTQPAEPAVRITIGRIEVRAAPPPPPPPRPSERTAPQALSLEDYLDRRHGRRR